MRRRVVITGMGLISPVGNSKEALWDALANGRSGVGPLTAMPAGSLPMSIAAEARQFQGEIDNFGPLEKELKKSLRKGLKVMCRECQMGVAAAQLALQDSRLVSGQLDPQRIGISFGSDYMVTLPDDFTEAVRVCVDGQGFEFDRWAKQGMPKMSPLWLLKYLPNMPASHIAIYNDLRGPSNSITLREASANLAIAEACQIILRGRADVMLCGTTGTRLSPMKAVHAVQQEEVACGDGDPAQASRPFDLNRQGMVLGEGAGAVILEELETARARGATIYAEVVGGAGSSAIQRNLAACRDLAMKNVLAAVLSRYAGTVEDIGHLHAHGLSTRKGDLEEARAIHEVFGNRAKRLPVVAAKSCFGNLGAGSGMVELIASVLAFGQDRLFRVLNYETPDPACPVGVVTSDDVSPGQSFINLSVTPQGQASAMFVRRFEG
ncbi:MAG: beta-ketoacyl-[acyl-carrier-protein] synthase family protein [Thermoguttaceae bacterium]